MTIRWEFLYTFKVAPGAIIFMEDQVIEEKTEGEVEEDLLPTSIPPENLEVLREMMRAGLLYGHKKSKTHPKFKRYISATRNGIEIIDLEQTLEAVDAAVNFLKQKIDEGGLILVVATQPAAREAVLQLSEKFKFPYINERWIGGLLTNFKVISSRIEYFKRVQADFEKGEFGKYTKKERVMISRNIERMRKIYSGLENLTRLPDALFIVDTSLKNHATALREAHRLGIPVAAILDSDDNPEAVAYSIPANDHTKSSIEWIINKMIARLQG